MSEPLAKERPSVDLDDFERRLRQHDDAHRRDDDPLAELARLVGETHDPYGEMFAREPQASPHAPASHQGYAAGGRREPAFGAPPAEAGQSMSPRLTGDFAAIEAGLRGAFAAHPEAAASANAAEHEFFAQHEGYHQPQAYGQDAYAQDAAYAQDPQAYLQDHEAEQWAAPQQPGAARAATGRSRSVYAMVATIAVCTVGIGVAFAYKGTSSSPGAIKTIAAASGPTKIQPPAEAANDQGGQDSAMLGKASSDAPTKVVSREEQPVDVSQAVQENTSRNADAGGGAPGDASNVPVPPSPSQAQSVHGTGAQGAGGQETDMMGFGAGMPQPKKVKVVSVRPDGTILPNDAPPSGALPPPRQAAETDGQDPIARASTPQASTPKAGDTPRVATPKTTSRVSGAPKRSRVADDDAPKPSTKGRQHVASVEPTDDTTASLGSHSGGGFAVQLAAPGSESDARSATSRLARKFSAALSGHRLGFHKAQSNGKSVYRVRVGSLSKEDAVSLCGKLKADGGSCFVAKNN